ncbi:hypothetical protein AAC387_Pa08g0153 [Persea americana]
MAGRLPRKTNAPPDPKPIYVSLDTPTGRQVLQCTHCLHVSETFDPILDLSLAIEGPCTTLSNALELFTQIEQIEGSTPCEKCKEKVSREKELKIEQAPEVLVLHLKRFNNDGNKIIDIVNYPFELDLKPFLSNPNGDDNLQCTHCHHVSDTYESMLDLSLAIEGVLNLSDALELFTRLEKIVESPPCEKCKEKVPREKELKIEQAPGVLVLHLMRFNNNVEKIIDFVNYSSELDLKPFLSNPNGNDNLQCTHCHHVSDTSESMLDLSLAIKGVIYLSDALELFTRLEQIEGSTPCEKCKEEVPREKGLKIEQAPEVLVLHLMRFNNNAEKIVDFVYYPFELDLNPFLSNPNGDGNGETKYDLYSVLLQCTHCHHVSDTSESILDLSLAIKGVLSLSDALELFTRLEQLEGSTPCEKCKEEVPREIGLKIEQAPEVLVLHLMRFNNNVEKIIDFLNYPSELNLKPFLSNPNSDDHGETEYDLYAVLVHHGSSSSSGHYVCYVRPSPDSWYNLDDAKVTPVTKDVALTQSEGLDDDGNTCFFDAKNSDTEMPVGIDNLGIGIQPADVDNQPAGLDNLRIRIQPAGISPFFQCSQQQDAHELHRCMLKRLQWDEGASFVNEIFGGCLRNQLQCTHCLHVPETFDPILDLSLAIEGLCDLSTALESFTRVEEMRDFGPCEKCKEKFPFERRVTIDQAPDVAVLHLIRFASENKKINNFVKYPLELDLQHFLSRPSGDDDGESKYDLYAVLVHHGTSSDFGHYFCFIRSSLGSWYILDDSKVTPVAECEVLNQEAYILFYRRQESPWFSSLVEAETVSPGPMWMNSSPTSSVSDSDDLVTVPVQFQSSLNGEFDEHTDAPSA